MKRQSKFHSQKKNRPTGTRKQETSLFEEDLGDLEWVDTNLNASQPQNRSDELADDEDPFIQQEQMQEESPAGNLADLFEAERQSRRRSPF